MSMQQQEGKLPENTVNKDNRNVVNSTEKKEDNVNAVNSDEKKEEQYELDVLRPFNEVNTNNDTNNINNSLDVDRKSEKETLKNNDNKNNNKEQQKAEGSPVVAGNNINLSKNNDISSSVSSNVAESDGIKKENDAVYNDKNVLSSMERFKNDINNNYEDYRKIRLGSLLDKKYEKDSEIKIDNLEEDFKKKLENDKEYQNAKKSARKSTTAMGVIAAIAVSPAGAALLPFAAICIGVLFASSMYHTSKAKKILEKHKAKMEKMKENIKLDKEIDKMSDPRLKQYYKYKKMIEREEEEIDDIAKKAKEQKEKALDEIKKNSSLKKSKSTEKNKNLSKDNNNVVNIKNNKQNAIVNDNIKKDNKAKDNNKKDVEVKNEKNNQNNKVEKKENLPNEAGKNKEKVDNGVKNENNKQNAIVNNDTKKNDKAKNNSVDKKDIEVKNKKNEQSNNVKKKEAMANKISLFKKIFTKKEKNKDLNLKESISIVNEINKGDKKREEKLEKNVKQNNNIVIDLKKDVNKNNNIKNNKRKTMKIEISRSQEEDNQQVKSGIETKIKVSNDANIGL